MFNVGGPEVLVILLVALIALGPAQLPKAARQVGQVMSEIRRVSTGFQKELTSAFEVEERKADARKEKPVSPGGPAEVAAAAETAPDGVEATGDQGAEVETADFVSGGVGSATGDAATEDRAVDRIAAAAAADSKPDGSKPDDSTGDDSTSDDSTSDDSTGDTSTGDDSTADDGATEGADAQP